jgi:hypothetical protein
MKILFSLFTAVSLAVGSGFAQNEWSATGTVVGFAAAGNGYLYEAIYDSGVFPINGGPALASQISNTPSIQNVIVSFIPFSSNGKYGFVAGVAALKINDMNEGGVFTYGFQSGPLYGWVKMGGSNGLLSGLPQSKSIVSLAWHDSTLFTGLPGFDLSLTPSTPGGLYSSTYPAGWISRNGPVMLDSCYISSLCFDGSTLYAGALSNYIASKSGGFSNQHSLGSGGVLRSTDTGQSWVDISPADNLFPHSRDVNNVIRVGSKLFISTFFGGVLYRDDGTGSWVYANLPYLVSSFATDGTNLYAGTFTFDSSASSPYLPGRVYRYVPSNNSWNKIFEKDSASISSLYLFSNTLYIGTGQMFGIASKALGYFTMGNVTGIAQSPNVTSTLALRQNYPNPFNPSTQISFSLAKEGAVSLRAYDMLGREVATLVNENRKAGQYTERFNANQLASGVYIYVLRTSEGQLAGRMMLLR